MKTIRAQNLVGRKVYGAGGRYLGRVFDLTAERQGDELVVSGLAVGPASWLSRFGWSTKQHGRFIPWGDIESLEPHIRLRHAVE